MGLRTGMEHLTQNQCPKVQVVATGNQRKPRCRPSTLPGQHRRGAAWGRQLSLPSPLPSGRQPGGSEAAATWQGAAAAWVHLSPPIFPLKRREDYNEVVLFP